MSSNDSKSPIEKYGLIGIVIGLLLALLTNELIEYIPEDYHNYYVYFLISIIILLSILIVYPYLKDWLSYLKLQKLTLQKHGVVRIHDHLDFTKLFKEPEKEVKILDTYIPNYASFLPDLKSALENGLKVKILVANPDEKITELRSIEIGEAYNLSDFKKGLESYISQICSTANATGVDAQKNLEMRYYSDLPGLPMYILKNNKNKPDKLYFSFFLTEASVNFLHFEVQDKGELLKAFEKYFDEKWDRNEEGKIDCKIYQNSYT